jgi:hypothetical protein
MLPFGQATNQAAKARPSRRDIHVATGLNAPSMALLPHFCGLVRGSIEKGEGNPNPKSETAHCVRKTNPPQKATPTSTKNANAR